MDPGNADPAQGDPAQAPDPGAAPAPAPAPGVAPAPVPGAAPAPAPSPADARYAKNTELHRRRFLRQQAIRHRNAIAANPEVWNQLVEQYDAGAKGGGHLAGTRATQSLQTELHAQDDAQRWINVQNQAKQHNVARQLGVPRGWVMAHEDVTQSLSKGDRATASAKAAMYAHLYGPTWLYAANQVTDQQAAEQAALGKKAEAEAKAKPPEPNAVESVDQMNKQIAAMPAGAGRAAAIDTFHRTRLGGQAADPKMVQAATRAHYQPIVLAMLAKGLDNLTPDEQSELQQAVSWMGYKDWVKYTGTKDDAASQDAFRRATGKTHWNDGITDWNGPWFGG